MSEFYTFIWPVHIFIISLLGICVLAQTVAFLLNFFNYGIDATRVLKNLFELLILFEIIILSLLYGQMLNGYENGFLVPTGYRNIRIIIFLVISIFVVIVVILKKDPLILSIIPATAISLPIIEDVFKGFYPWLFIGALIFFLIRSIKISMDSITGIRTNITAFSVPHGLDTLHTGVLFSEYDGHTLLTNHQMYKLMYAITGRIYRNSKEFYDVLLSDQYKSRYKKAELDGQTVYILNDGTAWIFTKTDISFRMKKYIHISAAEVTELWILTAKLQSQEEELKYKSDELKKRIANLHILSKKKEIDNARMRAHDILGQRLTVLLRIIQTESKADDNLLKSLSKGLLAELKVENNEIQPYEELKRIQKVFNDIGINIEFEGVLPDNNQQACLFVDIIKESCTNAVRHALATQINIKGEVKKNKYKLTISNNGYTPATPITPGNGIKVMRKKVSAQGGNLNIIHRPIFSLFVVLPGGEYYD